MTRHQFLRLKSLYYRYEPAAWGVALACIVCSALLIAAYVRGGR